MRISSAEDLTVLDISTGLREIKCRYLRIHITDVVNHTDLLTKSVNLTNLRIYGENSTTDLNTLRKTFNLLSNINNK